MPADSPSSSIAPGLGPLRAAPAGLPEPELAPPVVADVAVALQSNWMADYRNSSGIALADGPYGPTIEIEDSSRVDPWIVRQAQRAAAACTERLAEFSRRDRPTSGG